MNQVLKDSVFRKGRSQQISFLAKLSGMDDEEFKVLEFIHQGKTDIWIQSEMNMDRKTYERIEASVMQKTLLAVFECINYSMNNLTF